MSAIPGTSRTVALSRQRGSGGSYVGRLVAERLGLRFVDREMLRHACEYLRPAPNEEPAPKGSWLARLGQAFAHGGLDAGYVPPTSDDVYEGELFEIERKLLFEIASDHSAVVVGRGAAQALRGRPGVVTVFVHAPEAWRIARVRDVYKLDARAAERMVRDSDRARAKFVNALADVQWTDVRGYDLAIDTSATGFDAAADLIARALESRETARASAPLHYRWADGPIEDLTDEIRRTYLTGKRVTVARFELKRGGMVPRHAHANEQVSCVLTGALKFRFDDQDVVVGPAELVQIPGGLPHEVEVLEDTVVIDVFSPVRQDWIDKTDTYFAKQREAHPSTRSG